MANILIVEDDHDLNYAYSFVLTRDGHTVVSAYNGLEAVEALTDFKPDLILLDLLMPIKNGVEFLRDSDVTSRLPDTKIIVFTNLENAAYMNEARALGADKCIIKAWTGPQGLLDIVHSILASPAHVANGEM